MPFITNPDDPNGRGTWVEPSIYGVVSGGELGTWGGRVIVGGEEEMRDFAAAMRGEVIALPPGISPTTPLIDSVIPPAS